MRSYASVLVSLPPLSRAIGVVGLAVVMCLGLVACSDGGGEPDSKAGQSSKAEKISKDEKLASEALPDQKLRALSDHEAAKPEYVSKKRAPFNECTGKGPDALTVKGHVIQEFAGDPRLEAHGFALDGDSGGVFGDLRKLWAEECQSIQLDVDEGEATYLRTNEIAAPNGVDADSWFGACYAGTVGTHRGKGMCVVIYRFGDDGIAEIRSYQKHKQNRSGEKILTAIAGEALSG